MSLAAADFGVGGVQSNAERVLSELEIKVDLADETLDVVLSSDLPGESQDVFEQANGKHTRVVC